MKPSSTSSSEERPLPGGFPKALAAAVILLIVVEIGVRLADPALVIPYHVPPYILDYECRAVVNHVAAYGVADVCFVGSSRTRQGIVMPEVRRACAEVSGEQVSVADYAVSGGQAKHCKAIIAHLLRHGNPKLIMYGVSPRLLLRSETGPDRDIAAFWGPADWWAYCGEDAVRGVELLPTVIRNTIGECCRVFCYRERMPAVIDDVIRSALVRGGVSLPLGETLRGGLTPCPMRGGLTFCQKFRPERSLVTHPVGEERLRRYLDDVLQDGEYPMSDEQVGQMSDTIRMCRARGVAIVFFEVPFADRLHERLPAGVAADCRAKVREVCERDGARFVTLEDLGLVFEEDEYLEYSHLNYGGALRLTRALLERVVIPRGASSPPTTP